MFASVRLSGYLGGSISASPAGLAGLVALGTGVYVGAMWVFDRDSVRAVIRFVRPSPAVAS